MFLFLIELFLLGASIGLLFQRKLPDLLLALLAPLFGLVGYFLNVFLLVLVGLPVNQVLLAVIQGVEIVSIMGYLLIKRRTAFTSFKRFAVFSIITGGLFIFLTWYFFQHKVIFGTADSLYLITMGESLLNHGFSEWYFASPYSWGIFVPILQTLGMIFGNDYTWFIQPVISIFFVLIFAFILYRASFGLTQRKALSLTLTGLATLLMLSSNIYWISQFYIHTNLDSGISFFLVMASLYLYTTEKEPAWLGLVTIFLIVFTMLRIENVLLAAMLIVIIIASKQIPYSLALRTFLPCLVIQLSWNMFTLFLEPDVFTSLITPTQLMLVSGGLLVLTVVLLISKEKWFQDKVIPLIKWGIICGFGLALAVLIGLEPQKMTTNIRAMLTTMFISGKWQLTWWLIWPLLFFIRPKEKLSLQSAFNLIIYSFFFITLLLGFFRRAYHTLWFDSANRIYLHIFPTLVFYVILRISSRSNTKALNQPVINTPDLL